MTRIGELKQKAREHNIIIISNSEKLEFYDCCDGAPLTWMYKYGPDNWSGFSRKKEVTNIKRGTKLEVMDWCLNWSINSLEITKG